MKTREQIQKEIDVLEAKFDKLHEQLRPIEKQIRTTHTKLRKLKDEFHKSYLDDKSVPSGERVKFLLYEDGRVEGHRYEARQEFLQEIGGLSSFGYNREISQVIVNAGIAKDDEHTFKWAKQGLEIVIPHLKPYKGYKRINILTDGYDREILIDQQYHIAPTYYGYKTKIEKSFDTLEECLKYVQENYPMDSEYDEDDY